MLTFLETGGRVKLGWILLIISLLSLALAAQSPAKRPVYAGGSGGIATLSGDGSSIISSSSASTSLFDPENGGAADVFAGIHLFEYVSFQTDYVWNRNQAAFVSTSQEANSLNFFREPASITQNAFLANVLVYFRKRRSRIRPYVSEGGGAVFLHSRLTGGGIVKGAPVLPPATSDHTSLALRTSVGIDIRLEDHWYFRYSFGETITRNTLGDQIVRAQHGIPKNFQNLFFGVYYQF
jgi:hypothetical protein